MSMSNDTLIILFIISALGLIIGLIYVGTRDYSDRGHGM